MRVITVDSVSKFIKYKPFRKQNMAVNVVLANQSSDIEKISVLILHGNHIAKLYRFKDGREELWVSDGGWASNTTKERLNGLFQVIGTEKHFGISQIDWKWFMGIHPKRELWNGAWTRVEIVEENAWEI